MLANANPITLETYAQPRNTINNPVFNIYVQLWWEWKKTQDVTYTIFIPQVGT